MKKTLALIIIGLFVSVALLNGVSATTTEENDTIKNRGPIYFSSKPLSCYIKPGFVIGYYTEIDWRSYTDNTSVRSLYSPHMLFGWHITRPELYFPIWINIGFFATRVSFFGFPDTFHGFFSGTEPGFVCGIAEINCHFNYPPYP